MLEGEGTELRGRGRSERDQETGTLHHSHPKTASTSSAPLHSMIQPHLNLHKEKPLDYKIEHNIDARNLRTVEIMVVL